MTRFDTPPEGPGGTGGAGHGSSAHRMTTNTEAVGHVAASVAHDFNNLLTVIVGTAEISRSGCTGTCAACDALSQIQEVAAQAGRLANRLLRVATDRPDPAAAVDVNDVVRDLDPVVRAVVGGDIDSIACLDLDLRPAFIHRINLEQVLINLVVNARDAMPTGGLLTIETANRNVSSTEAAALHLSPGPHVSIAVRDTGTGMSRETQNHALEKAFITGTGRGRHGLGLWTCSGVAGRAGGAVALDSTPGAGTVVTVFLPALDHPPPGAGLNSITTTNGE